MAAAPKSQPSVRVKSQPSAREKSHAREASQARQARDARASSARDAGSRARVQIAPTAGERPQAPWHPLPLSELLILFGAIGTVVGLGRGVSQGGPPLFAGIVAVLLGTVEVTLREHSSGYRSHTILLSVLPVIVFHSLVVLAVAAFTRPPQALNLGLLAIDFALFLALFRLLRARFVDARRKRAFGGR